MYHFTHKMILLFSSGALKIKDFQAISKHPEQPDSIIVGHNDDYNVISELSYIDEVIAKFIFDLVDNKPVCDIRGFCITKKK